MWLFYALLGPPFWALVHIIDSHCVGNVFDRPWMGVITSSLATAVIAVFLPLVLPFGELQLPEIHLVALALFAGGLVQLSQTLYFQALETTEAGIVAAYGNFTPILMPIASYFLMGEVLEIYHYIAIAVLVLASICFCLLEVSRKGRADSVVLMLVVSIIQIAVMLIEKYVFMHSSFYISFMIIIIGVALSGVLPLIFIPKVRKLFKVNMPKFKPLIPLFIMIEVANLIALFMSKRSIDLGSPTLSAGMESTIPGFTFVLTILLVAMKHKFGDEEAKYKIGTKLVLVGIMSVGVMQLA